MFSKMKTEQRRLARTIRREEGAPIKEIARRVGVAPSSVSLWVRDIKLTPGQERELLRRNPAYNRQLSGTAKQAANRRAERIAYQQDGRRLALEGEARHIAGCMLYWAEGEKDRNALRFSNSDPEMVRFFVSFIKTSFDLADEEIKVTCYLFADHVERQREVERYLARGGATTGAVTLQVVRQCLLKAQQEEANQQTSLRDGASHSV